MEPFVILGICCLVILFIAGAVNGAYDQLDYYESTLLPKPGIPSKWSPQKMLKWIAIVLSIVSIILGLAVGFIIIDVITKAVCKERGIVFMPRCL